MDSARRVIIHVGPHKTGSTAIQRYFSQNRLEIESLGVSYLHNSVTHQAAQHMAREEYEQAECQLRSIGEMISHAQGGTVILSQEDFCGDLPGRSSQRAIYPKMLKNFRCISRHLKPHRVEFLFILRNEADWLRSCYHQHLRFRTRFCSFDQFFLHYGDSMRWSEKLKKIQSHFDKSFVAVPYSKELDAGVNAVLELANLSGVTPQIRPSSENVTVSSEKIRLLERINKFSSFKATAWFSKSLVVDDWQPRGNSSIPPLSMPYKSYYLAKRALPDLSDRASGRVGMQDIADILPDCSIDLEQYISDALPKDASLPEGSRAQIENQAKILDYHFRGKSQLAKLCALTISYLRRDTSHTPKARVLFHRIWREHGRILVNEMSTRWLISSLQTFAEHGENQAQKIIGVAGYFYANMMKIYEGERSIEGLAQDGTYSRTSPSTPNKFSGLDRFNVGGTDLLLNTNAFALDLATEDDVAGLILIEILLRTMGSANVFTRMDRTRKRHNVSVDGFIDTWSFFREID